MALAALMGVSFLSACDSPGSEQSGQGSTSAAKHSIVDAETTAGFKRDRDHEMLKNVSVDPGKVRKDSTVVVNAYVGEEPEDPILFIGEANIPSSTEDRREYLYDQLVPLLSEGAEETRPEAQEIEPGPLGGSAECMTVDPKRGNNICGWVDSNTTGVAVMPDMTLDEAGRLFISMRSDIER
ncbi:hypothetical protein [Streptomyces caelestis]|uniref:hypothetical protein n=1 Tax=Streptomyces caelestis TaxID=36816 RepID=UPI003646D062